MLILEWKSNPTSDSYADSVLSTILRVDTAARGTQVVSQKSHMFQGQKPFFQPIIDTDGGVEACKKKFNNQLDILLESMYGGQIQQTDDPGKRNHSRILKFLIYFPGEVS